MAYKKYMFMSIIQNLENTTEFSNKTKKITPVTKFMFTLLGKHFMCAG